MSIARSLLVKGPAKCIYTPSAGAATFFTKEDFNVQLFNERFEIPTSAHGIIDYRKLNRYCRASLTPEGRFNAALIAALWPHSGNWITPGTSIYDASADRSLAIHASDGALHTIVAAGVRQMPDILFSAVDTMVGPVEFGGVFADDADWDEASNLYTVAAGASFTDATMAASLIPTQAYTLSLAGVTGFTTIESLDGWRVSFPQNLQPWAPNSMGLMDESVTNVACVVTGIPINPTAAQIHTALGISSGGRGESFGQGAGALTIVGADGVTYLTIPSAQITDGTFGFGSATLRNGEVSFVALPTFSVGVPQPLFTLAAS